MTQIIERVARAMCAADVPRPFDELQECDQDDYRDMAQAALKEIKLDELLNTASGGLKDTDKAQAEANAKMSLISGDPFYAVLFAYWEDMQALLSELEKTDA